MCTMMGVATLFAILVEVVNTFLLGELLQFGNEICDNNVRYASTLCSAESHMQEW